MANTVTMHTIVNGSRNLILHVSMVADASGNFSNYPLINVLDYANEGERTPNSYSVMKVAGRNGTGTSFKLKFGSSVANHVQFFESYIEGEFCAEWPGLTPKNTDQNMTVVISTTGFDAANDVIDFTIWLKKKVVGERS